MRGTTKLPLARALAEYAPAGPPPTTNTVLALAMSTATVQFHAD